jgi:hypothetical protein
LGLQANGIVIRRRSSWISQELLTFKPVRNLGIGDPSINKARRFECEWKDRQTGVIWSHVFCVSNEFPDANFLVEYWDDVMSYAGKSVVRRGREIRHVHDGNQQAQGYEWVLPNIFCPYRAEYETGVECGVLWDARLLQLEEAVTALKHRYGVPKPVTTCESALEEWTERFEREDVAGDEESESPG